VVPDPNWEGRTLWGGDGRTLIQQQEEEKVAGTLCLVLQEIERCWLEGEVYWETKEEGRVEGFLWTFYLWICQVSS
jgi:hypothetical protein